jgi:hypothetical protein
MGGGGKGGSQTQSVQIPAFIQDAARRNLARAEQAQKIDYMPYYGADVAAFNPNQIQGMQANINAAEAFGLAQPGQLTPLAGMPAPSRFADGTLGYSSSPLYEQAVAEAARRDPASYAQREQLFVAGDTPYQPPVETAATPQTYGMWQLLANPNSVPSGSTVQMPFGANVKV